MDFAYSEEQRMLTDSLQRMMAEQWTYDRRRKRMAQGALDRQAWLELSELGVAGLLVSQDFGGFEQTPASMLAVHQVLGRGIVSEPVISSAVMAVMLLGQIQDNAVCAKWLSAHAEGAAVLAVAWQEDGERYSLEPLACQVQTDGAGYVLTGRKRYVWHGAGSDAMIVTARLDGQMALVVVATDAPGVSITDYPTFDQSRCADVTFDKVKLDASAVIATGQTAQSAFALAFDYALTALCAHACGAMGYLIESTTNYLKTRKQFGQPLINFQVLQHRVADMLIEQEMALSATFVAAAALSETDAALRSKRVSMVKTEVANAARMIGEQAVQLHGGMGVTDELEVGDYFKRLTYAGYLLGDNDFHLARAQSMATA